MLVVLWSPKGGSGTSTLAAACALVLARHSGGARLADLGGDQPALFGLGADPATGLADWLAAGPEAPTDALERLAVEAAPGVVLLPRGAPGDDARRGRGRRGTRGRAARRTGRHRRRRRHRGRARGPGGARDRPTCRSWSCGPATSPSAGPSAHRRSPAPRAWRWWRSRRARSARGRSPTCSIGRSWPRCRCGRASPGRSTPASSRRGCPTCWRGRPVSCSVGSGCSGRVEVEPREHGRDQAAGAAPAGGGG